MWYETEKKLPTEKFSAQKRVIMYSPGWATSIVGMFTYWSADGDWSQYDQINDKYYDFPFTPKYWMHYPKNPEDKT